MKNSFYDAISLKNNEKTSKNTHFWPKNTVFEWKTTIFGWKTLKMSEIWWCYSVKKEGNLVEKEPKRTKKNQFRAKLDQKETNFSQNQPIWLKKEEKFPS